MPQLLITHGAVLVCVATIHGQDKSIEEKSRRVCVRSSKQSMEYLGSLSTNTSHRHASVIATLALLKKAIPCILTCVLNLIEWADTSRSYYSRVASSGGVATIQGR